MGLFDRFRAQPKWKHADPAIRLSGVEEIPLEEQGLLATLAREDGDARVRRAAVRKLYDPALLKEVAARDEATDVREEAGNVLLDLAMGAFEDSSEAESLKALGHIEDERHLAAIAKNASAEAVSLAALARLTDEKVIGSVARRAEHASTRLEALARVQDGEEVFAIALRGDHRDVALAAAERVTVRDHLKALVARATQKPVVRRARAALKEIEDAEQAAQAAAAAAAKAAPAPRDWNAERDKVCRAIEEAAGQRDWRAIESRLAAAEADWAQIEREAAAAAAADRAQRFADLVARARLAIAQLKQQETERAERQEQSAREQAARVAVCTNVEAMAAELARRAASGSADVPAGEAYASPNDVVTALTGARQEWAALQTPSLSAEEMERLERRFERACAQAAREDERWRTLHARRARLAELVQQAEAFVASLGTAMPAEGAAGSERSRWAVIKQEWLDLDGAHDAGETLATRFQAAQQAITQREAQAREQEAQRQRELLQRLQQLCEAFESVAKAETITLKDGERVLREARQALDGVGQLAKKDRAEIAERLKAVQSALFPRVQELREADEWMRWANVGVQEDLCRQAEALREVSDAAEAARQLRDLQQRWKQASAVPRDKAQGLWERFKKAGDEVHARSEAHFAQEATERAGNLARKETLCQRAEGLAESTDWIKTAEAIKQLQNEWKEIGPVPRGHEKAVWERFRAACDRFFTRRREDLTKRKEEWAANLARKEALIAQARELAETNDWGRGIEEIKRLQAEWKSVGPVRKNRSEDLWQQFRGACDRFFERYQQRDHIQVAANVATREEICRELEAFVPRVEDASAVGATEHVEGESEPGQTGALPFDASPAPSAGDAAQSSAAVAAMPDLQPPDDLAARVSALRARWQQAQTLMPRETLAQVTARYTHALAAVVKAFPEPFKGSDLDTEANRRKAEEWCARVEHALPAENEPQATDQSPASILAARLREALAANTIGGVAVADNDARLKTALSVVKDARAAWSTFGPLPAELETRFDNACRKVQEAVERRKRS